MAYGWDSMSPLNAVMMNYFVREKTNNKNALMQYCRQVSLTDVKLLNRNEVEMCEAKQDTFELLCHFKKIN